MPTRNRVVRFWMSIFPASRRAFRRSGCFQREASRISVEALESRQLLTVPFQVHANSNLDQSTDPFRSTDSVAMDAAGNFVVTWTDSSIANDIKARRFDANRVPLGDEFIVNTTSNGIQTASVVAMNPSGQFVVVWTSADGSGTGIFAQRFDSNGQRLGLEFRLNTFSSQNQSQPSVAMKADGSFIVAWTSSGQDGSGDGVYVRRFNVGGVGLAAETQVNVVTANAQNRPAIGIAENGTFVVAWQSSGQDGSGSGIYARRFSALAVPQGSEFLVNNTTADSQADPSLSVSSDGSFIVSWDSNAQDGSGLGVYARRYSFNGASLGNEFLVNTTTAENQRRSHVGIESNGQFVILWESVFQNRNSIFAQRFQSNGSKLGSETIISHSPDSYAHAASLAMNPSGHLAFVWNRRFVNFVHHDVLAAKYRTTPVILDVLDPQRSVPNGSQNNVQISSLIVVFDRDMETASGVTGKHSLLNPQNWTLRREGEIVSNRIESIQFGRNATTNRYEAQLKFVTRLETGAWQITASSAISDLNGTRLDGNRDLVPGDAYTHMFEIVDYAPVTAEARIDTVNNGVQTMQSGKSLAIAPDGRSVAVYRGFSAGNVDSEIFARRYDEFGSPVGSPFRVNTTTTGYQLNPAVSINASGAFVVVWRHSGGGIRGQRFTATGQRNGVELTISATGDRPDVVLKDNGEFSVVWDAPDANQTGIFVRLFTNSGAPKAATRRVNTTTANIQQNPVLKMDSSGNHLVVWESQGQDGDGYGIVARRLNADTVPTGAEFLVNTTTTGHQTLPAVSMAGDGQFVIAWQSLNSSLARSVLARRFNAAGTAVGTEIPIAIGNGVSQHGMPSVAIEPDGDFIVAWVGVDSAGGTTAVRYGQYSAGILQGASVIVNPGRTANSATPTVAVNAAGVTGFVWADDSLSTTSARAHSRFYRQTGAVTRQPGNVLQVNGTRIGDSILLNQSGTGSASVVTVNRNGMLYSFPTSLVTSIRVDALGGHDAIFAEASVNRPITMLGGAGNDTLTGGSFHDVLDGGPGNDVMSGRAGNDRYMFQNASAAETDTVSELSGEGVDTLDFSSITTDLDLNLTVTFTQSVHLNRTLTIANMSSEIENVTGGSGNDTMIGNSLDNRFIGNAGHDFLLGFIGNDRLEGGDGNDILIGGEDSDTLLGGTGDDILAGGLHNFSPQTLVVSALRAEWSSANSYATRVANLRAGVGSPLISLVAGSAFSNDNQIDTMTGGGGTDWFFKSLDDVITDLFSSEISDLL